MQPTNQKEAHIAKLIPTTMKWQSKISHPTTVQPQIENHTTHYQKLLVVRDYIEMLRSYYFTQLWLQLATWRVMTKVVWKGVVLELVVTTWSAWHINKNWLHKLPCHVTYHIWLTLTSVNGRVTEIFCTWKVSNFV